MDLQYQFGFHPGEIGKNHIDWWIVSAPDVLLEELNLKNGDLCVVTHDVKDNLDEAAMHKQNFLTVDFRDGFCYYYFGELKRTYFDPRPREQFLSDPV